MTDGLLDEHQLAEHLNLSVRTLQNWRTLGRGPKYLKLGSAVRYQLTDITDWINQTNETTP